MNCEFLCVTFRRDLEYTRYMLRSLKKFATGFTGITLAVPDEDYVLFLPFTKEFLEIPVKVIPYQDVPGKGMLQHMVKVCEADLLCHDADVIFHFDADRCFKEPVTPADYMAGEKPVLLYDPYSTMKDVGRLRWKSGVEGALGGVSEWEIMARLPLAYKRNLYATLREKVTAHTGEDWKVLALKGPNAFPQVHWPEFNILGETAKRFHPDEYVFLPNDGTHPVKTMTFWSHSPYDKPQPDTGLIPKVEMEKVLDKV